MSSATHATADRARSSHAPARPQTASVASASIGGQALDRHTQSRMSAQFGHDFSQVRIHTDARAGETTHALGANAFTLGQDISFGAGRYAPGSAEGDRLLAHELTHVVQQDRWGGPGSSGLVSRTGDASEQEASSLDQRVAAGESVDVKAAPGAMIACDMFGSIGNAVGDIASGVGPMVGSTLSSRMMGSASDILSSLGGSNPLGGSPSDQLQMQTGLGDSARQMDLIRSMMEGQHKSMEDINRFIPAQ